MFSVTKLTVVALTVFGSVSAAQLEAVNTDFANDALPPASVNIDIPITDTSVDIGTHSRRHLARITRKHNFGIKKDLLNLGAGNLLAPLGDVFDVLNSNLSSPLSVLNGLTGEEGDLPGLLTTNLGQITSLLNVANGLISVTQLNVILDGLHTSAVDPTEAEVATSVSTTVSTIGNTLFTVQTTLSGVPLAGSITSESVGEIQIALATVLNNVQVVAGPVLAIASSTLAPMSNVLSSVGLGSVSDIVLGLV